MKCKKILAGILSIAMLTSILPTSNHNVDVVEAVESVDAEIVYLYEEVKPTRDFKTNSVAFNESNGTVMDAFDGDTSTYWHQNWLNGDGPTEAPSDTNPIYVQAGFSEEILIGELTYQSRKTNNNIIKKYEIQYANVKDSEGNVGEPNAETAWTNIASGEFINNSDEQSVKFGPVSATHIRLVAYSGQSANGGDSRVTASEIKFFKAVPATELEVLYNAINEKWNAEGLDKISYDAEKIEWVLAQIQAANTDEKKDTIINFIKSEKMDEALPFVDEMGVGVYVSDVEWLSADSNYGPGYPKRDTKHGGEELSLLIADENIVSFKKGIGAHATATVTVDVSDYLMYRAYVGLAGSEIRSNNGYMTMNVYLDDELQENLAVYTANRKAMEEQQADLANVSVLKLEANERGFKTDGTLDEGNGNDHAVWADAKLYTALVVKPEITIDAPVAGGTATVLTADENAEYSVTSNWKNIKNEDVTTFASGNVYMFTATYSAKDGYCFTEQANGSGITEINVVSGEDSWTVEPAVQISADKKTMTVSYRFAVSKDGGFEATDVALNNISNIAVGTYEDPTLNNTWGDGDGAYLIDNNHDTRWHSQYRNENNQEIPEGQLGKFWVDFEMVNLTTVDGLRVLNHGNGQVTQYEVWTSTEDAAVWGEDYKKVCEGTWNTGEGTWKSVKFEATGARHVRLVAKATNNSNKNIALREMRITTPSATEDKYTNFLGGGLRINATPETNTNLRFGYELFMDSEINGMTLSTWKWSWGLSETNLDRTFEVKDGKPNWTVYKDKDVSNLVITGVPASEYDTSIYAQLKVVYTNKDGESVTVYTAIQEKSVEQVADAILSENSEADDHEKEYATAIKATMQ